MTEDERRLRSLHFPNLVERWLCAFLAHPRVIVYIEDFGKLEEPGARAFRCRCRCGLASSILMTRAEVRLRRQGRWERASVRRINKKLAA